MLLYIVTSIQMMYIMCTLQRDLMHNNPLLPAQHWHVLYVCMNDIVCTYIRNWLTTSTSTVSVHSAHGPTVVHILNGLVLVLVIGL